MKQIPNIYIAVAFRLPLSFPQITFNLLYNTPTLSPKYKAFANSKLQFPLHLCSKQRDMHHIQLKTEVEIVNKSFYDATHLLSSCTQDSTISISIAAAKEAYILLDEIKSIYQPWQTMPDYIIHIAVHFWQTQLTFAHQFRRYQRRQPLLRIRWSTVVSFLADFGGFVELTLPYVKTAVQEFN